MSVTVQSGYMPVFDHYDDKGPMWFGSGDREVVEYVRFDKPFTRSPYVALTITQMDTDTSRYLRYELFAKNIRPDGFDVSFKTWSDSRFARISVHWIAMGERTDPDLWHDI